MNPREDLLLQAVATQMESHLGDDSTGHDMHHAWRVCNLGVRLAEEMGADPEVVGAAALTHDLHRVREPDGADSYVHPEETLPEVREILAEAGFPEEKRGEVLHCVAVHDAYAFEEEPDEAETLEAEIVQDADNLDAMGAVGIARAFAYGGAHGNYLWDPDLHVDTSGPYDKTGDQDAERGSTLHHFEAKLLRLKDTMNTRAAREIAAERHRYLAEFVERFEAEWRGEK